MCPVNVAGLLALAASLMVASVQAQAQGARIAGAVEDSIGAPIPQVQVVLVGTSRETVTDARGAFAFSGVRPGVHFVRVRRLGYEPLVFRVDLADGDTVSLGVQLNPSAAGLAPVVVREDAVPARLREVGFEDRRRFSGAPPAQFLTREEIQKRNPVELSQMLLRMGRRASQCHDPIIYLDGMVLAPPPQSDAVGLMRSIRSDSIQKLGASAPRPTQLSGIPPALIEGMEVYAGPSEIPSAYNPSGRGASCVILLWLR